VFQLLSPRLIRHTLNIPNALQPETLHAFYLLALSLPIVITTAGLRGILEALQRFDLVNVVRVPLGLFTFLGPLLVLPFSRSLFWIVLVLVVGRLCTLLVHFGLCLHVAPSLRHRIAFEQRLVAPLLHLGSWMTASNILGPLLEYLDRFLIGSLISMTAVAYYTTPYEVITKVRLIPAALVGVLFPAFASTFASDKKRTERLFRVGVKCMFLVLFPITLLAITFAHEGLAAWLGPAFAINSTRVLQWLAIGVLLNSLAQVPFALIQGVGRPDVTAKLHLIELPLYATTLWFLVGRYGILGAAVAWVLRVAVDTTCLFGIALRVLRTSSRVKWNMALTLAGALVVLTYSTVPANPAMKGLFVGLTLGAFVLVGWLVILSSEERAELRRSIRTVDSLS